MERGVKRSEKFGYYRSIREKIECRGRENGIECRLIGERSYGKWEEEKKGKLQILSG